MAPTQHYQLGGPNMFKRVMMSFTVSLFAASIAFAGFEPLTPNPDVTPGDVCTPKDHDFAGYRYKEKIAYCERDVSYEQKTAIYEEYNVPLSQRGRYTIDHFIPLAIGGSNSPENLWPEHKAIKRTRPLLEQQIYEAVAAGEMTQKEAIKIIIDAKMNPDVPKDWQARVLASVPAY